MSTIFSKPGLGLGLNRAGQDVRAVPAIKLSNPSSQTVTNSKIQFNAWSVYLKFANTGAPASTEKLWRIQRDGSNMVFLHRLSNANIQLTIISGGVAQSYYFSGNDYLLEQGDSTIVIAAKEDDVVIAVNGVLMYFIDSVSMPTGTPLSMGIGQNHDGSQQLSDDISEFHYYDRRLTNAQVKALGRHQDFGVSATFDHDRLVHFKLGQSNSVGTQAAAPSSSVYTNLARMQIITKDGALDSSYQDPSSHNGAGALFSNFQQNGVFSSGGVEIDGIASAQTGKDIAVMHIDRGDTGLVEDTGNFRWLAWNTSAANEVVLFPIVYQAIVMQMIGALHGKPISRTWWQGERDAGDAGITQVQYRNALVALLRVFDEYVRVPTIVVGLHDAPSSGYANWSIIQAAQAEINSYYALAHHVSAVGLSTVVDEVHLDQDGYLDIGEAIADQINALI